ncbi:MAG: 4Fe-4S dicluster domain-containing protein [Candidatus Latescibacteria bacterium]|nr:4Fe-4S dicluster domain-containing protein [bacterium]MBD3422829.1 4Fe-4S dicluster domain-containing protein [Candidatus Latescibacterota bacterium]
MEKRVYVDMNKCIGCRSCAAACAEGHHDQGLLKHGPVEETALIPLHCRHCDNPLCLEVCPEDAIHKTDDGVIVRENQRCIGCKSCVLACPFGVMLPYRTWHISPKCDLCVDRLEEGQEPRCVSTCTTGALIFEELAMVEEKHERVVEGGRYFARFMLER